MSNTNRDYLIICDVKNSKLTISRPIKFYITDKNTSNIFIKLVTQIAYDNNTNKYVDIEPASSYVVTMRIVKPNNETKSVIASKLEEGAMYQVDLKDDCKDIPGMYKCELLISTIVYDRQELNTSDMFTYKVERSVLSNVNEIIETEDTTVEDLLNRVDTVSSEIKGKVTKQELEIERKRIDNLTTLTQGSTTGDAELIDARIGIDGITYPNLGTAIRTQLGNVGISPYVALPFELTPNQFVSYFNGSITTHDNSRYMASSFIRLVGIGNITIKNLNYNQSNNGGLAFYDTNKKYIQGYKYEYEKDLTLNIPKNASYLRFTYFENEGETRNNVIVYQCMYDIMHLFNDNILNINTLLQDFTVNKPLQILHSDKFVNKNGTLITDSGSIHYNVSAPISIKANEVIKIVARGYLGNVSILSQYIDDTTFKPLIVSTDNEIHEFVFSATEDMNVVVCSHKDCDWQFVLIKDTLKIYEALNKLKEDLNTKINYFNLPFIYSTECYIGYSSGAVVSHTNDLNATDFIDIEGVTYLDIFNLNYPTKDNGGLAFYNANQYYIQGYQYDKDVNLSIKVPKGAKYVRLTIPTVSLENVFIKPNVVDMINQLKQEIEENTRSENLVYELTLKQGYYIHYASGVEAVYTSDGLCASNFVELNKQHTTLYVDNLNYTSYDFGGLAFYDTNKNFIQGYQYNGASNLCLDIPSNACYVRLTTKTNSPVIVYSKYVLNNIVNKHSEQIKNLEETINALDTTDDYDYCQIFHKIAGIGDSLMSGELAFWSEEEQKNKYVDCYKYSWLSNLCKNIGAEPVHYSRGGATTKTWLERYLTDLKAETVKPSAYFIALGTNDTNYVELGTVDDCDTDNETFYGMYSKIIREVQQFNPHAKVFCFSLYYRPYDKTVQNYCNAIKTMSERYGCYYVDFINAYGYTYTTTNKNFVSVGHFTAPGYVRVGKEMQILVNDIIRTNQNDFKFIGLNYKDI